MDAKPQRPLPRTLRIYDENLPPANGPIGKTLHQRTKSTSALSGIAQLHSKKVLGETNTNVRLGPKDDSEIGKASPGKIRITQEPVMPVTAATFHRPAVRPFATRNGSSQSNGIAAAAPTHAGDSQPAKKVVPKKSKVLRDVLPAPTAETLGLDTGVAVPAAAIIEPEPLPAPLPRPNTSNLAVQHQEVHRIENIPLRDEAASRPLAQLLLPTNDNPVHAVSADIGSQAVWQYQLPHIGMQQLQEPAVGAIVSNGSASLAVTPPPAHDELEDDFDDGDQDYMTAQSFDLRADLTVTTIFNPQHTKKNRAEIAEAKAWVEQNRTPDDIEDELWDTSMVAEYGEEIFDYMREMEARMSPNPYYMDAQTEIQWSMRGVLMDWVVQVHQRFNLLPETLFLTVNYIDRFLSAKIVSLGKLQLVGATAIFLAAKYEEVNCPTISEIIYMVDNGYTSDELLKAERFMLSMLQFELGWPGPMSFLRRISKADDYDLETRTLAKYFLEVTIMDERFVGCKPSFLAAGAHCMARLMLRKGDWTKAHVFYSNYTFRQLHQLLGAVYECCSNGQNHHSAVFDKYTDKRYKRASTFVQGQMMQGFKLPFSYRSSSFGAQNTTIGWLGQ